MFTDADHDAPAGAWSWFDQVVGPALEAGPTAELRPRPADGHISVLDAGTEALEWLAARRG